MGGTNSATSLNSALARGVIFGRKYGLVCLLGGVCSCLVNNLFLVRSRLHHDNISILTI